MIDYGFAAFDFVLFLVLMVIFVFNITVIQRNSEFLARETMDMFRRELERNEKPVKMRDAGKCKSE